MKQDIYPELKKIENELKEIKLIILKNQSEQKKLISLKGILKGSKFEEKDIENVKKSLFKNAYHDE